VGRHEKSETSSAPSGSVDEGLALRAGWSVTAVAPAGPCSEAPSSLDDPDVRQLADKLLPFNYLAM